MATYNGAKYLREQIDSILRQTVQDFELIVCDDCSSDETMQILCTYAAIDPRIKVYQNEHNLGFKKNFEKAISLCSGDYVALSDQDDIWMSEHLNMLMEEMTPEADIICGRPIFVNENNQELPSQYDYFKMDYIPRTQMEVARHMLLGNGSYQGASMLIKRSFFDIALPIPSGANYHDSWFAVLSCFLGGLIYVDRPTMRYRRLTDSITLSTKRKSAFRTFLGAVMVNHALTDRLCFIENIKQRVPMMSDQQKALLDEIEEMLLRRKSLWGRLRNIPYCIKHFKSIYTYDGKHLFT